MLTCGCCGAKYSIVNSAVVSVGISRLSGAVRELREVKGRGVTLERSSTILAVIRSSDGTWELAETAVRLAPEFSSIVGLTLVPELGSSACAPTSGRVSAALLPGVDRGGCTRGSIGVRDRVCPVDPVGGSVCSATCALSTISALLPVGPDTGSSPPL